MTSLRFRAAGGGDAGSIAELHADSWRRHYRGAYADSFLDGDVVADRRVVWAGRLAAPDGTDTVVAERDGELVGFVHLVRPSGSISPRAAGAWRPRPSRRRAGTPAG